MRDQLLDCFDDLKRDPRRREQVREQVNAAGKIIATVKAQLEYSLYKGEEPDIPFLGKTSGRPLNPEIKMIGSLRRPDSP